MKDDIFEYGLIPDEEDICAKENPLSLEESRRQTQNNKILIYQQNIATCIKVWAVVVTLLLALVLWFGSYFIVNPPIVYVETSTPKPVTEVDHKTSDDNDNGPYVWRGVIKLRNSSTNDTPDTGIIQQDAKNDTYFIMKQASDGNIEVLSVIDYKKKVAAWYLPANNMCVISKVIARDDLSLDYASISKLTITKEGRKVHTSPFKIHPERTESDLTMLPTELQVFCRDRVIYWAEYRRADQIEEACTRCWYIYYHCNACIIYGASPYCSLNICLDELCVAEC